jgi:hypothetical protein
MAYEEITTINATEGLGEFFSYLNSVTASWFSNGLLITIYVIFVMGYYRAKNDFMGGIAIAGFATFIVALFLRIGGVISGVTFGIVIGVAIVGIAIILMDTKGTA